MMLVQLQYSVVCLGVIGYLPAAGSPSFVFSRLPTYALLTPDQHQNRLQNSLPTGVEGGGRIMVITCLRQDVHRDQPYGNNRSHQSTNGRSEMEYNWIHVGTLKRGPHLKERVRGRGGSGPGPW